LFELDFEEVSKKKLRECWSQLCRIRCRVCCFPWSIRYGVEGYTRGGQDGIFQPRLTSTKSLPSEVRKDILISLNIFYI